MKGAALNVGVVCFPSLGGSGVVAVELALGLAERGHRLHLIAASRPSRAYPSAPLQFHEVSAPSYPLFEQAPYTLALASKLAEVARRERLDLVHVHYAVPHSVAAVLARQIIAPAPLGVITTLHGTDVTVVGCDPSYRPVTAFAVAASDVILTPSDYLRRAAEVSLGLDAHRIDVMANFVDTERFAPAVQRDRSELLALFADGAQKDGPILFHVSTFRPVKRVLDLIELLARVRRRLPVRLVAVGDGPDRAAAEARAATLGVSDAICFLGGRSDFVPLLQQADAFVLPSETESFGLAALEALSAGVPVFAYRVGGLPELIDDSVGRLVAPFDLDAFAQALVEVLSDRAGHARLAASARARAVAHFSRGPAIDRYESLLRRMLESP